MAFQSEAEIVVNVDVRLKTFDSLMISPLHHSLFQPKVWDALLPVTLKLPSSLQKVVLFKKKKLSQILDSNQD